MNNFSWFNYLKNHILKKHSNLFLVFLLMLNWCILLLLYNQRSIESGTLFHSNLDLTDTSPCLLIHSHFWSHHKCSYNPHLIRDICLLLEEFAVVTQFMIFPLELLGSAEKPMPGPSSSKGKIMKWAKFQIIGGKHNCSYYLCYNHNGPYSICLH